MPKKRKLVHVTNARAGTYRRAIRQIVKDSVCPFCTEHLHIYHKKPILWQGTYWLVTKNMYPYKNTKTHFLLIHKRHIDSATDVSKKAWIELQQHIQELVRQYKIPGGTMLLRFGDPRYTGSSVTHLHVQLVSAKRGRAVVTRI